jgi:L-alanine-DL-glutamate epimerase-like enolase superfamily enzyme
MRIERVEVLVVGPERRHDTWSHDLPPQYQSNTLIRLFTDAGLEGVAAVWNAASYDYDRYTAEALRHLIPLLIGRDPLDRASLLHDLRPRVFPRPPGAMALIDIALWDLAGKQAGQPIWRLLGGQRERIPAYASTPMYADVDAYMRVVDELLAQGFRAIKFHTWCVPEDDLALAREARRRHPDVAFMLDAENNYAQAEALRVARELDDLGFTWFEAPLPDQDLEGYAALVRQVAIPILPAGNWVQDLSLFAEAIRRGAWSRARTDVTILGGITPVAEAMALAAAEGMQCELMSWGYTLASAANLHSMLGFSNCSYYEQPLPYETFEYGMKQVVRTGPDGQVRAPGAAGLGLEVDWPAMRAASVHELACGRHSLG